MTDQQTYSSGTSLADLLAPALGYRLEMVSTAPTKSSIIELIITPDLILSGNEGYTLEVSSQQVTITGAHLAGLFYGIQTLRQLLPVEIFSSAFIERSWGIPGVFIKDAPRFPWRGLMLDTARHFIPFQEILKIIDLLALHKMNVLHLHLTDDQGWRIEIKKYPRLTEIGSHRTATVIGHAGDPQGYDATPHAGFYSQDELREIVAYAEARFITVMPEIEIPGHAQAAVAAYPEFGVTGEPVEVGTNWGIFPYLYNPTEETLQFLQDVLSEVIEIFPGPFIHIGGDEACKQQWKSSARVQARIKELKLQDEEELQSWFLTHIGTFLARKGRRYMGWDEILEGGLPSGAAVMSWQGISGGILAAQADHDVVMTPYSHVYLDYYQSNDPAEPLAIGGYTPLDKIYSFEPVPAILTSEQAQHILGAQCNLWTEYVDGPEALEYMLFPRLIALAEVTWTPREQRNYTEFCQRLATHEDRLSRIPVNFRPVARLQQEAMFPFRETPKDYLPPQDPAPGL
jgi:hexosaminidase